MWFLERFNNEEIQVIEENNEFLSVQEYLKHELELLENGDAEFISIEELENNLESSIRKHEN